MPLLVAERARLLTDCFTTNAYAALFSTAPDESGAGGVELTQDNYARINVAPFATYWSVTGSEISNILLIEWTSSASVAWPEIVAWGLFSASTGGTPAVAKTLAFSFSPGLNQKVSFAAGQLREKIRLP